MQLFGYTDLMSFKVWVRSDYTEIVTNDFVKYYNIKTKGHWIDPGLYYNERLDKVNTRAPDGTYILVGASEYYSSDLSNCYKIGQFSAIRLQGFSFVGSHKLKEYPNSSGVELEPIYPLIHVGKPDDFKKASLIVELLRRKPLTQGELRAKIVQLDPFSVDGKIYRLRLALSKQIGGF